MKLLIIIKTSSEHNDAMSSIINRFSSYETIFLFFSFNVCNYLINSVGCNCWKFVFNYEWVESFIFGRCHTCFHLILCRSLDDVNGRSFLRRNSLRHINRMFRLHLHRDHTALIALDEQDDDENREESCEGIRTLSVNVHQFVFCAVVSTTIL